MDSVVEYLLNFALDKGFGFILTDKLKPDTPSCANPQQNKIVINTNWRNKNELPFQIAHEIGHMLNGDEGTLYYNTYSSHSKIENNADNKAIDLLLDYCVDMDKTNSNYSDFMYYYGIPNYLEQNVKRRYANYFIC
ncbi:ImmA/IrrE family metallo-endopeptidase [Ligilactobacillus pobuzihii]|uniref:ImmA/IrrE family metallo-endopeptidase n=1 Tax=Ligilactobacillus pobuzihii TaxID=449659 RepID=UPI0019D07D75|nr:ImmA/IrrE family metallo-endopeptidase [Ligilactobacillus pobuzihii]MBN7275548.1 ImmA/IrrE family metallo-endopeptidase [Ligilactobacillus pobuzihii]